MKKKACDSEKDGITSSLHKVMQPCRHMQCSVSRLGCGADIIQMSLFEFGCSSADQNIVCHEHPVPSMYQD